MDFNNFKSGAYTTRTLILQWGYKTQTGRTTVSFPVSFTYDYCLAMARRGKFKSNTTPADGNTTSSAIQIEPISVSQCIMPFAAATISGEGRQMYIAIGF